MERYSKRLFHRIKLLGVRKTIGSALGYFLSDKQILFTFVVNKNGLEIGGPSASFFPHKALPIYPYLKSLDNVNFSETTLWNKTSLHKDDFHYGNRVGKQFIMEASALKIIPDERYDFVASSHVIEHLSNPIKAIFEMKRVVKAGGFVILVAPHKETTFDHNRKITTLQHMIHDFEKNIPEGDTSHLDIEEIVRDYDFSLDSGISGKEEFIARTKENISNRALHQHVFVTETILQLVDYCSLKIILVKPRLSYGVLVVSQKLSADKDSEARQSNLNFFSTASQWRSSSPFLIDKDHAV